MNREQVRDAIRDYILTWSTDEEEFDRLFMKLVQHQVEANPVYRRFVESKTNSCTSWDQVPPLPVSFFKEFQLRSYEGHRDEFCWESSGTTGKKSRTYLSDDGIYNTVIRELWPRQLMNFTGVTCRLIPNRLEWPHSSLSHFFATGLRQGPKPTNPGGPIYDFDTVTGRYKVNYPLLVGVLEECEDEHLPLRLVGTSYAIASVFDHLEEIGVRFQLEPSSFIVDTGGYKGIVADRSRDRFVEQAVHTLGVQRSNCLNEYGMSELSSHFWSTELTNWTALSEPVPRSTTEWWRVPPWVRVKIVDPITGEPDRGGVAVFYDLANVWSVAAIQTEDHIDIRVDRQGTYIRPIGRHVDADLKGCSITAERAMQ